jgi:hypothetical protein
VSSSHLDSLIIADHGITKCPLSLTTLAVPALLTTTLEEVSLRVHVSLLPLDFPSLVTSASKTSPSTQRKTSLALSTVTRKTPSPLPPLTLTSARVTPWNLLFPTRTESPLPRTPSPIVRNSLPESYERTRLASPASTSSLDALAQVAAVAPRSVTPELQYPDPLEVAPAPGGRKPFRAHLRPPSRVPPRRRTTYVPLAATPLIPYSVASGYGSPPQGPPPSFVQAVSSSSPPSDQENIRPPLEELTETPLDPYLPPACIQNPSPVHPHQFFIVELDGQQVWRPISEGQVASFLSLPSHDCPS